MFESTKQGKYSPKAPQESYDEASSEEHTCECPKCGFQGKEKDFIKPEFFNEGRESDKKSMPKHVLTITMGDMKGMGQGPYNPDEGSNNS